MKITVRYGARWYGNSWPTGNYHLVIERTERGPISINFKFLNASSGRGVGENQGYVTGALLELDRAEARKFATHILMALEDEGSDARAVLFNQSPGSLHKFMQGELTRIKGADDRFALLTDDRRSLAESSDGYSKILVTTPLPHAWQSYIADHAMKRWNSKATTSDQVTKVSWRSFLEAQIERYKPPQSS